MVMYAIGTLPLIHKLQDNVTQVWYADDASAGRKTSDLHVWWAHSCGTPGPEMSYNSFQVAYYSCIIPRFCIPQATEY